MSTENNNTRIYWRTRRGMLELDVILKKFYHAHFANLSPELKQQFELLLEETDPQLYRWLIGSESAEGHSLHDIVEKIIQQHKAAGNV